MKNIFFLLLVSIGCLTQCNAQAQEPELYYLLREPKVKISKPPVLILLHGVGSNEKDLFSLAPMLPDSFLIICARAPFTISEGSYKWYELKFYGGKPVINAAEAEKSRQILLRFIDQLEAKHQFDGKRIFLGGFSQGAIMSFSVALSQPKKLRGVVALSGRVLEEIKPHIAAKEAFKGLEILIIHGTEDKILPVEGARAAKQLCEDLQIKNEYHEFKMAHTINKEALDTLISWLKKR